MLMKNKIVLVLLLTVLCVSIGSVCATDIDDNTNTNDQVIVNDAKISNEIIAKDSAGDLAANSAKQEETPKLSKVSKNNEEDFMDIIDAAYRYKKWVEENKKLPSTVKVGNTQYSHEDFTYLMARTIQNINKGDLGSVETMSVGKCTQLQTPVCIDLPKERYLKLIGVDLNNVYNYGVHASSVKITNTDANIRYEVYSYGYSKILVWADQHYDTLPSTCLFDSSVFKPSQKSTVTINEILDAAKRYQNFVKKNGELPEYVTVGGKSFSKQQFTYAMAQAIYQLGNGNKKDITIPSSVKMCTIKTDKCNRYYTKYQYTDFAKIVAEYVRGHGAVPSYVKYAGTVVPHVAYAAAFANILSFYKNKGKLASNALFSTNGLRSPGAGEADDADLNPNGVDADALKESQNNAGSNNVNSNSKNLPATGNPILVLLFALAVLPILRFRK